MADELTDDQVQYTLTPAAGEVLNPYLDPGGWDLDTQLPGMPDPVARVRADVAAAAAEASTSDLIAQILAELRQIRAELAALAAKDAR